jgi:3,4-dihydroxy 2-butanone 4-phosphate synthase/GTP cyclohydrolase II
VLDVLDIQASTHAWPLLKALERIARSDGGVLVMLNCGEASEDLLARLDAITSGTAEVARSTTVDLRTYGVGAQILRDLGVRQMKLLAKPRKMPSMAGFGLQVTGYLED